MYAIAKRPNYRDVTRNVGNNVIILTVDAYTGPGRRTPRVPEERRNTDIDAETSASELSSGIAANELQTIRTVSGLKR